MFKFASKSSKKEFMQFVTLLTLIIMILVSNLGDGNQLMIQSSLKDVENKLRAKQVRPNSIPNLVEKIRSAFVTTRWVIQSIIRNTELHFTNLYSPSPRSYHQISVKFYYCKLNCINYIAIAYRTSTTVADNMTQHCQINQLINMIQFHNSN